MMNEPTAAEILNRLKNVLQINGEEEIYAEDRKKFREEHLDSLVYQSVFHSEKDTCDFLRWLIRRLALSAGAIPSSIDRFYRLKGEGKFQKVTVPAINVRGLSYDFCRSIFRAAAATNARAFIFEIAKSEMGYTHQEPDEFVTVILAAALREGFSGPIFVQGDHFQFNAKNFAQDPQKETEGIKNLISEAIQTGFYNIDIDASTLVTLDSPLLEEQQKLNIEKTVEMTQWIRSIEPEGVTVSVGGEIGEVGGKNSTVDELKTFLDGFSAEFEGAEKKALGLSKLSVQTGTTHGGVPLPDGKIAEVALDFEVLKDLGQVAMKTYHLGGVVQHGASTLPEDLFEKFPEVNTCEIHLATAFQNLMFDGGHFPKDLYADMLHYMDKNFSNHRGEKDSYDQFVYKNRKRLFGPFKRRLWDLPEETRTLLREQLQSRFEFLFKKLNAKSTFDGVTDNTESVKVLPTLPEKYRSLIVEEE